MKKGIIHKCKETIKCIFRGNKEELVETTISLRTKYLAKEVKILCDFNFKVALLALLGSVVTAVSVLKESGKELIEYVGKDNLSSPPVLDIAMCIVAIVILILSIYSFVKQFKVNNPTDFVNKIVSEQYDVEEFTAIFIIKAMFENIPKILVFRSEVWESFFLPYCHYDNTLSDEEIKKKVKIPLSELLEINLADFEIYDDFTKKTYIAIKKNMSHQSMSKINYRFYYVKFSNPYVGRQFLNSNLQYFSWKSKYELGSDKNTQLNNGDIVSIIDELSLINQSKLAFQERALSSYEINSRYSIIWNITNECYFNCPICATNSGKSAECGLDYNEKLNILLNLSSINGYIEQLDISGGDPLKSKDDRQIIKKANQILAYTDIRVTTTGKALEELSINEIIDTVKKCDITYDIPYEICNDELQKYREYYYNYYNFRQLEKFSNSGVKIELNIHIPILPATIDKELIGMILDDLHKINPAEVKFIRLMPVGRLSKNEIDKSTYSPEQFLNYVDELVSERNYKFKITYNCSLGTRIKHSENVKSTVKKCGMLKRKLGIDCNGRVYACIWGAYIQEFQGQRYKENPFYLGDLNEQTMYEILTEPSTLKLLKNLEQKSDGCRVCAYVNERFEKHDVIDKDQATRIMLENPDPLQVFYSNLS